MEDEVPKLEPPFGEKKLFIKALKALGRKSLENIPMFHGKMDLEVVLEWIEIIENCFECEGEGPTYSLSLFSSPSKVAAHLESIQRNFMWSRLDNSKKYHLVAWESICKPKKHGGLGIRKLK